MPGNIAAAAAARAATSWYFKKDIEFGTKTPFVYEHMPNSQFMDMPGSIAAATTTATAADMPGNIAAAVTQQQHGRTCAQAAERKPQRMRKEIERHQCRKKRRASRWRPQTGRPPAQQHPLVGRPPRLSWAG